MRGLSIILVDLLLSTAGGGGVYMLFCLATENIVIRTGVPIIIGICLFFVLTAVQSGTTPEV